MKISILGCGWLGLPLAKQLIKKGFSVKGSTTSEEKISILKDAGILPFLVTLNDSKTSEEEFLTENTSQFLKDSQVLIINIPPKLRGNTSENFVKKMQNFIPFIEKSSIEKVLFVSSTSVYGDAHSLVTEETTPNPETESGKQLLEVEKLLQSNSHFKTTILRFGGLVGEDRHPIKHLAGRENCENPDSPINLIHQEDCIGIIERIIELNSWDEVFNAVSPYHPSREKYYTEKATVLSLPLPKFVYDDSSSEKIISCEKVEKVLEYSFSKSNL